MRVFLNAGGKLGEETEDVKGFLEYVHTNRPADDFSAELAAAVRQIKANNQERDSYMSLAMDIQQHIEREKENWIAEGRTEGRADGRNERSREIAMRLLQRGLAVEQIAKDTDLTVEDVRRLSCQH